MAGFFDTDERRGQDGAHWTRIDPAVGVTADGVVHWAMIEARAAANTAQHFLKLRADHFAATVIEQNYMVLARAVRIFRAARAG